jgi:hypothetical protein
MSKMHGMHAGAPARFSLLDGSPLSARSMLGLLLLESPMSSE